ncbi:uncharacterized protein LOC124594653 [Schistocerca americana]|uniref:uncharacterized protein LOC124594653 n=1 Tax=Schistocerca americana TaxID=7009 RepID=UPI001F4F9B6A|nr:uncharacterized protein LOC124594653 [Schistocerca americana]
MRHSNQLRLRSMHSQTADVNQRELCTAVSQPPRPPPPISDVLVPAGGLQTTSESELLSRTSIAQPPSSPPLRRSARHPPPWTGSFWQCSGGLDRIRHSLTATGETEASQPPHPPAVDPPPTPPLAGPARLLKGRRVSYRPPHSSRQLGAACYNTRGTQRVPLAPHTMATTGASERVVAGLAAAYTPLSIRITLAALPLPPE